ncbi:SDR family oxidoreductase [Bordetella genomosp. 13]|uniref:SDR family oxidoreductase n=1 Tax=Bordetella genomosp. 13 TaxID=463040 RepID=UPI0011A41E52|nr:SDR family oxidoreductase [Bordetella genomosp. 13]
MSKTWFITGASAGLGRLLAERLLARGDRVVATARRDGALDDLQSRHGDRLRVLKLDVTDTQAIRARVGEAFQAMGRIDVVVSNAAYGLFGAAEELSDQQIDRQIATNLTGSIQLIRAVLPHLRAQGGGRIVQVSSEGGQIAYPDFSLYHATKWGIEGFVEAVAQEVGPFGIDFLIVEPGPTHTSFGTNLDQAEPMACYADTPSGAVRRALADGDFGPFGDAGKTVDAMIPAMDAPNPPLRLALGQSAYESIRKALAQRLRAVESQKDVALSVMP